MLTHDDYDSGGSFKVDFKLPKDVNFISFSYDGGRLHIAINDKEVYTSCTGTRDFNIEIDRKLGE